MKLRTIVSRISVRPIALTRKLAEAGASALILLLYVCLFGVGVFVAGLATVYVVVGVSPFVPATWPLGLVALLLMWAVGLVFAFSLPYVTISIIGWVLDCVEDRSARSRSQTVVTDEGITEDVTADDAEYPVRPNPR